MPDNDRSQPDNIYSTHSDEQGDSVTIVGITRDDAVRALKLLETADHVTFAEGQNLRKDLVRSMTAANLDLVDPAAVAQARRLGELRAALLATPAYSYTTLSQVRGDATESATRTWVSRNRAGHRLFTIKTDAHTIIPAFQLTDEGQPRPELRSILDPLMAAGIDSWTLWHWLTTPSTLLSDETPEAVASTNTDRARTAAQRFASRYSRAA